MRRFVLHRFEDASGVSGTGIVAEGVEFDDGQCVLKWRTHIGSLSVYSSIAALAHVHGHRGKTRVEWVDEED